MVQGCPVSLHHRHRQTEFLVKVEKELGYLRDRSLAGIDTLWIAPTKKPRSLRLVEGSSGYPEVCSCGQCNNSRKACPSDETLNNFHA